ncbi:MAG: hypothetical protein MH252_14395 [Thermosynechococcaceae cyanobacterium MS004]|nr:hypothetical protein [Thermosynechococcaceae cyanobacterium MS004]
MSDRITVEGTVQAGHGVASGSAAYSPYPQGTLEMQRPFFADLGLDLSPYFLGTLNVSIAPWGVQLRDVPFHFPLLRWTHLHPPETFSFWHCTLEFQAKAYAGLVYYPHPETKQTHFQPASILELLLPKVAQISSGDRVLLQLLASEIALVRLEE